jgi:hypothetical protein
MHARSSQPSAWARAASTSNPQRTRPFGGHCDCGCRSGPLGAEQNQTSISERDVAPAECVDAADAVEYVAAPATGSIAAKRVDGADDARLLAQTIDESARSQLVGNREYDVIQIA